MRFGIHLLQCVQVSADGTGIAHLHALQKMDTDTQKIYRALGRKTVDLALKGKRITPLQAEKILAALDPEEGP